MVESVCTWKLLLNGFLLKLLLLKEFALKAAAFIEAGILVGQPALTLLRTYVGVRYTGDGPLTEFLC